MCVHVYSALSDSCDPLGCSLPASSVHGIFQERILEWDAISFSTLWGGDGYLRELINLSHLRKLEFSSFQIMFCVVLRLREFPLGCFQGQCRDWSRAFHPHRAQISIRQSTIRRLWDGFTVWASRASLVTQVVKNPPAMQEIWVHPWVGKMVLKQKLH